MQTLRQLLRAHHLRIVRSASLFLISAAAVCLCDVSMIRITGSISQAALDRKTALMYNFLFLLAAITAVKILFGVISTLVSKRFEGRTEHSFRGQFAERVVSVSYRLLSVKPSGELLSIYTNDLPQAAALLSQDIPQMFSELMTLLISAIFMALIKPWFTLIFFLLFPPLTLLQVKISTPIQAHAAEASIKRGIYNSTVNDSLQNTAVVVAYSLEEILEKRYQAQYKLYFATQLRRIRVFSRLVISGILATLIPVFFIFIASALSVAEGKMSPGNFIALTTLALSANTFLTMLSQRLYGMQTDLSGARRLLGAVPDIPEETAQTSMAADFSAPAFEFSNVSFSYTSCDSIKAVEDINLIIPAGSRVAIVGSSGCGKSTLMKIMLSLLTQDTGNIRVFGTDANSISRCQLRRLIAYVPQDSFLFPGTIRENLAWAREDDQQDEEAMQAACRAAGILSFIEELPAGFDTILTESADNISGGQRQRLAIARALYRNAPILLLDEATSGLDPATEQVLLQAFNTFTAGQTVVVVAHRLAAVTSCDRILVMDNGHIIEDGTYDELMSRESLFSSLYHRQLQEEQTERTECVNTEVQI